MRHIRPAITEDMAKTVACALVGSRLDYIRQLCSVRRVIAQRHTSSTCAERCCSGSRLGFHAAINKLALPTGTVTVKFKIACITYKTISTNEPAYLHSLVPAETLRSVS